MGNLLGKIVWCVLLTGDLWLPTLAKRKQGAEVLIGMCEGTRVGEWEITGSWDGAKRNPIVSVCITGWHLYSMCAPTTRQV